MNNDEAWVSEMLKGFKFALLAKLGEEAAKITLLQEIITREKTNYCDEN